MGKVNKILFNNFRNFKNREISFNSNCNIFFGNNGVGKTNILEGISLLSKGRGFRNSNIFNLIFNYRGNFQINAELEINNNLYDIKISSMLNNEKYKKTTFLNDDGSNESQKFLDTSLSFLYFLPEMERLFLTSPSFRRNFIDKLIFSENKNYNKIINKYKKNLLERNKVLQSVKPDESWLNQLEKNIVDLGLEIYDLRNKKISVINDSLNSLDKKNQYPFKVNFNLNDNFFDNNVNEKIYLSELRSLRGVDCKFGGSKIGPHKSDFKALINNNFEAAQLSTGQQKTLVLMMLISQSKFLINEKKIRPILLFDEICSHLDKLNRELLLDLIQEFDLQVFITGTEKSLFSFISTKSNFYNITE